MEKEAGLLILKIGTDTLIDDAGKIRTSVLREIFTAIKEVSSHGYRILIVTSGAVRLGRTMVADNHVSRSVAASIGQPFLFNKYQDAAMEAGMKVALFLLSRSYFVQQQHFLILQKTYNELFSLGIIPIVNENDALVAGTDSSFGDNDGLAATLAIALNAKKVILVSNVDGLFNEDPKENPDAKLIEEVDNITDTFLKYCSKQTSGSGTGGMISKLKVARICTAVGIEVVILNGLLEGTITKALAQKKIGTTFFARKIEKKISNRDRWILTAKNSTGSIEIDAGAVDALRSGKSLLAVGVKSVYGKFEKKEVIEVLDKNSRGVAFGIVDFSGDEIEKILKSQDVHKKRLIHANNLFILN
jgi:glutamate 5-kinase